MPDDFDLSNVRRAEADGRLMASSFDVSVCELCDAAHFDFNDLAGNRFCSALIPLDMYRGLAAWLLEAAAAAEKRTGKTVLQS